MPVNEIAAVAAVPHPADPFGVGAPDPISDNRPPHSKVVAAVATRLGMSLPDLRAELRSGRTLDEIAGAKGLSRADLISTIKAALGWPTVAMSESAVEAAANRYADDRKVANAAPPSVAAVGSTQSQPQMDFSF